MRVLGIVEWTTRDKIGSPIAGLRPLVELQKVDWRPIEASEEFPTQGQVFWHNAQGAAEDLLVMFRVEANPGQKDEFKAVDAKFAHEVLDLRTYGTPEEVRGALASGIRFAGHNGTVRVFIWCKPDVVVGPVELTRTDMNTARLSGTNLHHLPVYAESQIRPLMVDRHERLLRADEKTPSNYVDWDDDAIVLRRALEAAVRIAKESGRDTGLTKKKLEEAVRTLVAQGVGSGAQLDLYRLERALAMLKDTELVTSQAAKLAEMLRGHPLIESRLEELGEKVRADIEKSARADLDQRLAREQSALSAAREAHARVRSELDENELKLRNTQERLTELVSQASRTAADAEAAVDARVIAAINRPLDLLAEVSVLRPLLVSPAGQPPSTRTSEVPSSRIEWSRVRGENIDDKASLRRSLTSAARARGVDPSLMLQIHAAVASRLTPATIGPRALAALIAYGHAACGGRVHVIHVSPTVIQPRDLYETPGGGIMDATAAAQGIDGISLVVLEGANRCPLEASAVPFLESIDVGIGPISITGGLRLSATLVLGATTVPVTSHLWSHGVAIYAEPNSPSAQPLTNATEFSLSSEVLELGDVPTGVVDALIESWPDCSDLRPAMRRFGSALTRFYDEEPRVAELLLHNCVLPYVASALTAEEQTEALNKAGDKDGTLAKALRRLRKSIC
jgi:hypothetical protein